MTPITYVSDNALDYTTALTGADTLEKLKALCEDWKYLCWDAYQVVEKMTPAQFKVFRAGLLSDRSGVFPGDKWAKKYCMITMPIILFEVAIIEHQFQAPWGLCFLRMKEFGRIVEVLGPDRKRHVLMAKEAVREAIARESSDSTRPNRNAKKRMED